MENKLNATTCIAELFKNHKVDYTLEEGHLMFKNELVRIESEFIGLNSSSNVILAQLNIYIFYGIKPIIETFAGFGETHEQACFNALDNFTKNSFHTILSAFFTSQYDEHVNKYQWNINGKMFNVTSSNVGVRGQLPENCSMNWIEEFNNKIKKQTLTEGVHSARLFYGQQERKITSNEVYLDNEIREDIQQETAKFDFTPSEDFYTLRIFMILQNGIGLERIAWIILNSESQENMCDRLSKLGFSPLEIDELYSYITEAFGQKLIQAMGVEGKFSNQAIIINKNDEEFPIDLNKEPLFIEALNLATEITQNGWSEDAKILGSIGANFNALNNALNEGMEIENINCSSFSTYLQFSDYVGKNTEKTKPTSKKPFWKFW